MDPNKKSDSRRIFLKQLGCGIGVLGSSLIFPSGLTAMQLALDPTGRSKRVLVLGAGLAGLSAAWELKKAGHDVTVLEARNRPGGRVSTVRAPFAEGLFAEEGAAAYSSSYTQAIQLIEELGIERIPYPMPEEPVTYVLNGKTIHVAPGEVVDWPYDLTPEEQKLGPFGLVKKYLLDTLPAEIKDPQQWDQPPLIQLDTQSLGDYMTAQGASPGAVKLVQNTMWFAALPEQTSGLSVAVSDMGLFMGGLPFLLKEGNDQLPREMARNLGSAVSYETVVKAVEDDGKEVKVVTEQQGQTRTYSADEVIVALPLKVLEKIRFEPGLPERKRAAIAGMPVINLTRTIFQVDRPFWSENGLSGGAYTDRPVGQINVYTGEALEEGPALLESYVAGPHAKKWGEMPEEEAIDLVKNHMREVYPEAPDHIQEAYFKAWSADPLALGGPSWPAPGDVSAYLSDLQQSHGRIHFAGEYASILRSTMEGALRSGLSAAQKVHEG